MKSNQQCKCCVNDKTIRGIKFNNEGVCNFCSTYKKFENQFHDYTKLENLFYKKIKNHGHQYDVALGLSGGKDSTYVLYQLIYKYKLKVCTYTLDNGFLSDEAKSKIDKIVNDFHVQHEYVSCDQELLKKMYHYIGKKYLSPCIACSFLGYASMINYASKVDAAVGMHGRSIPQMLRNFDEDVADYFKPFILEGLQEQSNDTTNFYSSILNKIANLVDKKLAKKIKNSLLRDAYQNGFRPFISYFLYHPYQSDNIIRFLETNTNWRVESEEEHFDCIIHHGALYLKNITARRHHLMPEYSVMIREKTMTKEEALKKLVLKDDIILAKKELKVFCKFANLNYRWLIWKAKIYAKRWW